MTGSSRRDIVAVAWSKALIGTSFVPRSRPEIEEFLRDCLDQLLDSLVGADFTPDIANSVGAELFQQHFRSPAALGRTMTLLSEELPRLLPETSSAAPRVNELLGYLATGYSAAQHEVTLAQQEAIQQVALRARDNAEAALAVSEARFRAVFNSSVLGIAVASLGGVLEDVNVALGRILRCSCAYLRGRSLFDVVDANFSEELRTAEARLVTGEVEQFQVKTRFCGQDGIQVWTQISASLVRDRDGTPEYQVLLYEDVTEQHMLQRQMHRQATHDPLTGLANRTLLQTRMDTAVRRSHPGRRVGLGYFDLDGFKAVNDSLGHDVGDKLLRTVAKRMQLSLNSQDVLAARLGGDEFVVLVPDSLGAKSMVDLVEGVLNEITRPVKIGGHELKASASVGIVDCEVANTTTDQLLRDADITLYRAKSEGKAQWVLYEPELNEVSRRRFQLSTSMPAALESNEFFVEYWPVLMLDSGDLCTVEAEIRWDHPEFGELDAADFLGLAQETGLITKLSSWMLRQACTHGKRMFDRLGEAAPVIASHLSKRHFRDPDLVYDVQCILRDTGLPPSKLRLIIPENGLLDEHEQWLDHIELFREMGVALGVSEFGGSFTSLARLRDMAVGAVRISASYVPRSDASSRPDPINEHILSSLVDGARLLDLTVVAAGVEDAQEAEWLRNLGVSAALGPYTGGLASAMEIEAMIAEGTYTFR